MSFSKTSALFYNSGLVSEPIDGTVLSLYEADGAKYVKFIDDVARVRKKDLCRGLNSKSESYRRLSKLNFHAIQLPLEGDMSFTIFEPLEYSTPGDNKLNKLAGVLSAKEPDDEGQDESNLIKALRMLDESDPHRNWAPFGLTMPKFKFEKEVNLEGVLKSMGLQRVFFESTSELGSIFPVQVYLKKAMHQAVIEVNKEGIKAAAVTKLIVAPNSAFLRPPKPIKVEVTKPFIFVIRYEKIPLFVGQIANL